MKYLYKVKAAIILLSRPLSIQYIVLLQLMLHQSLMSVGAKVWDHWRSLCGLPEGFNLRCPWPIQSLYYQ